MINRKAIFIVLILTAILLAFFMARKTAIKPQQTNALPSIAPSQQSNSPQIVSTKPDPLDEVTIPPTQVVELTFNIPIENIGEFKYELTPKTKYQSKLSDDRKTVILTPDPTWPVGSTFTLNISPLTKFDGGKRLKEGLIIHFKTINYKGV